MRTSNARTEAKAGWKKPSQSKKKEAIKKKQSIADNATQMSQFAPIFEKFGAQKVSADMLREKNNYNATMRRLVKTYTKQSQQEGSQDAFFIVDMSSIVRQLLRWKKELPRVEPYYAVKCNPNPAILAIVDYMGMGFDCASAEEISQVCAIERDAEEPYDAANRIIFANPCKQISHIRHARENGVTMCTVDNVYEVQKLKQHWPDVKIVIRIKPDDSQSKTPFSSKFGASIKDCKNIIKECKELNMSVIGCSFHVGTGCYSAQSYANTLEMARQVFDLAKESGYELHLLDIGGGFPGSNSAKPSFPEMAVIIREQLDKLFPADCGVKIIAEPGRYVCTKSHTLVTNVHSVRDMRWKMDEEDDESEENTTTQDDFLLYINDGIYGSMNNIVFDHYDVKINTLKKSSDKKSIYECTIFGPTCDSVDVIAKHIKLPEIKPNDWLYFTNLGAYTTASASKFNGFGTPQIRYIWKDVFV